MKRFLFLIVLLLITSFLFSQPITVASFNIQDFGQKKSSNNKILEALSSIITQWDVIAIQEISDKRGDAPKRLKAKLPSNYGCILSSRVGSTEAQKEQFGFIYNDNSVVLIDVMELRTTRIERSPFVAYFKTFSGIPFVVVTMHLSPKNVEEEIRALVSLLPKVVDRWEVKNLILTGDFNADGNYFKEEKLVKYFPENEYQIIIGNNEDTTIGKEELTYDRIIITKEMREYYNEKAGVFRFNFTTIESKKISDHFPVFASFFRNY